MIEHFKLVVSACLTVIILVTVSDNNTIAQTTVNPDSTLQLILNNMDGTSISLIQAQEFAGKNSTAVKQAEAVYLAALGTLRKERGGFDPEFFFILNYENQKTPAGSFFSGASVLSTQRTTAATGLRLNLPVGTNLELTLNSTRLKTNSQFAFLNPEYDVFGSVTLRQPLLEGFNVSARKNLKQAELNVEAAKALYDQQLLRINSTIEQAYWSLYAAERDYAVQLISLQRAESLLREAQLREKAGLVGPNQVANAKTFWAEQKLFLIDREELLDMQSDRFAVLIGKRPDSEKVRFITSDDPPSSFSILPVEELIEYSLNNNLELQAVQKNAEIADVLVSSAFWQALPKIDLVGSLTSNGLGGTSQDIIFGGDTLRSTNSGSFSDVLSQVFKRQFPGWSVGVEISLPIGLRTGLGEQDRLEAGSLSAQQSIIELSRLLEQQIRTSHRELLHGKERLQTARDGVDAAQEQVRIGTIEFQNGRLTAFELVRLSADFATAQQRYSEALVKTVKAAAELKQLTSGFYPTGEVRK